MIIVLMGYMASGKTAVGKALSDVLDYSFDDLDHYIEATEKMSIPDLFKTKGEIYFRKLETIHLENILKREDDLVLALGGGTPCYGNNLELIDSADHVVSFYLKASLNTLVARLSTENESRPLVAHLNSETEIKEFIGKHLFERTAFYSLADHSIDIDNKTIDEIVEEIILNLF